MTSATRKQTGAPRIAGHSAGYGSSLRLVSLRFLLLATVITQIEAAAAPVASAASQRAPTTSQYYGAFIGKLSGRSHNVSGDVFAVDEQTLFIKNFNYDGLNPDTYFWSGVKSDSAGPDGFIVPDEKGSTKPLERYQDRDVVLRLPEGKTLREVGWLSVWSRQRRESAGDIAIGARGHELVVPRPLEIQPFSQLAHGLRSGPITIVDAQTFLVPELHYDGLGPAAYFWLTRGGQGLSASGLRLKDENGSSSPLRKYAGETVVISLPDDLTVYDFDYFGVWCKEFQVNFGQTRIPQAAKVPPSPKMLGIKPENKLNCEILYDDLGYEIRWVLDGDDIVMQLVGKIEPGEYMAFGLGKDDSSSDMKNADAVLTWVDRTSGQVHAVDYFLGAKQQCQVDAHGQASGSCPDVKLPGGGDSLTLLHGAIVNGYSMVTFKRPQLGVDDQYDQHVYSDGQQSVLWAIGSLNDKQEVGYHRLRTKSNMFIDFARTPQWNCPIPDLNASMHHASPSPLSAINSAASQLDSTVVSSPEQDEPKASRATPSSPSSSSAPVLSSSPAADKLKQSAKQSQGWFIPAIVCPQDRTFYAQIGPTAGQRGYESLTGRPGQGAAWYINGLLIPELVVERGQVYRFVVEGGNDKTSAPRRHPFYLTDSSEGGFDFKTDEERMRERLFAGVALRPDGQFVPTAEGRLCEWRQTNATLANPDLYQTFSAYQRSLKLDCGPGQAGVLKFSPDSSTPETIYYQCYTHRYMGARIKVVDSCAAYLSSLNNSAATFRASGSQNVRTRSQPLSRRQAEARMGLDYSAAPGSTTKHHQVPFGPMTSGLDFGDDSSGSSPTTEFSNTAELMLTNGSSSAAPTSQQLNLSNSLEQLLKLSPVDLEIIESQANNEPTDSLTLEPFMWPQSPSIPLHSFAAPESPSLTQSEADFIASLRSLNSTSQQQVGRTARPVNTKTPKTLHSYMRRLASMYYPVQQQLASILASQGSTQPSSHSAPTSQQIHQQQQSQITPQQQASQQLAHTSIPPSSFSLSVLVPKPKIDLSKSGLSKKLNKLRFKTGRKYEPTSAQTNPKPPTPANEFNYDIFNNQLAQLEQQQKQFQALEMASWPTPSYQQPTAQRGLMGGPTAESYNYLPMVANEDSQPDSQSGGHQAIFGTGVTNQQALIAYPSQKNIYNAQQSNNQAPQQNYAQPGARLPIRVSETPLGPPTRYGQQPYLVDYLSMAPPPSTNRNITPSQPSAQYQQSYSQPAQYPQLFSAQHQSAPQSQQQAVFVTRLAQPVNFQSAAQSNSQRQPDRSWSQTSAGRHLGNQAQAQAFPPETSGEHYASGQIAPMSSVSLSTHSSSGHDMVSGTKPTSSHYVSDNTQRPSSDDESLNGSGSGSHYLFRQQPNQLLDSQRQGQQTELADHMIAIERYSKQPSERQQVSIVHPVTGELVLHTLTSDTTEPSSQQLDTSKRSKTQDKSNHTSSTPASPSRYSTMLIDKHLMGSSEPISTQATLGGDMLELAHSMQITGGDLQRLNISNSSSTIADPPPGLVFVDSDFSDKVQRLGTVVANSSSTKAPPLSVATTSPAPAVTTYSQQATLVAPPQLDLTGYGETPATASLTAYRNADRKPKQTLLDKVKSSSEPNQEGHMLYGRVNYDSGPFTPIELSNPANLFYQPDLYQQAASSRFRPSAFLESMLGQYQSSYRPEPPVQVASYLAQQLGALSPSSSAHPGHHMAAGSQYSSPSSAGLATSDSAPPMRFSVPNAQNLAGRHSSDLIILKPAALVKQTPQTYLLKPEYLTNQYKLVSPTNSINEQEMSLTGTYYNDELGRTSTQPGSVHVAGHQFDRLSSLSSPPSSSMALDPMHVANSVATSYINHLESVGPVDSKMQTKVSSQSPSSTITTTPSPAVHQPATFVVRPHEEQVKSSHQQNSTARDELPSKEEKSIDGPSSYLNFNKLAQHRQTILPSSKPISFNIETNSLAGSSALADGMRLNPGGENTNNSARDNNTDNAILSHVMSLISSNAVPTPPLIPVSSYSNADYFLPISDLIHRSIQG